MTRDGRERAAGSYSCTAGGIGGDANNGEDRHRRWRLDTRSSLTTFNFERCGIALSGDAAARVGRVVGYRNRLRAGSAMKNLRRSARVLRGARTCLPPLPYPYPQQAPSSNKAWLRGSRVQRKSANLSSNFGIIDGSSGWVRGAMGIRPRGVLLGCWRASSDAAASQLGGVAATLDAHGCRLTAAFSFA